MMLRKGAAYPSPTVIFFDRHTTYITNVIKGLKGQLSMGHCSHLDASDEKRSPEYWLQLAATLDPYSSDYSRVFMTRDRNCGYSQGGCYIKAIQKGATGGLAAFAYSGLALYVAGLAIENDDREVIFDVIKSELFGQYPGTIDFTQLLVRAIHYEPHNFQAWRAWALLLSPDWNLEIPALRIERATKKDCCLMALKGIAEERDRLQKAPLSNTFETEDQVARLDVARNEMLDVYIKLIQPYEVVGVDGEERIKLAVPYGPNSLKGVLISLTELANRFDNDIARQILAKALNAGDLVRTKNRKVFECKKSKKRLPSFEEKSTKKGTFNKPFRVDLAPDALTYESPVFDMNVLMSKAMITTSR